MIQITQQTVGELWGFSWLELYLEIYRHHHVTLGFPGSRLAPEIRPSSHAGAWLLTDLATSALAPLLFGVLALLRNRRRTSAASATDVSSEMTFAWTLITAGALLTLLGALNQAIQATPLEVDLTLRHGNGGFMVLGLAILSAGMGREGSAAHEGQCEKANNQRCSESPHVRPGCNASLRLALNTTRFTEPAGVMALTSEDRSASKVLPVFAAFWQIACTDDPTVRRDLDSGNLFKFTTCGAQ